MPWSVLTMQKFECLTRQVTNAKVGFQLPVTQEYPQLARSWRGNRPIAAVEHREVMARQPTFIS